MKQKIIILICILIIGISGYAEIKYLKKTSIYLSSEMDYIENVIKNNNYELAKEQVKKSYDEWTKIQNIWNIFIVHDEVDQLEEAIIELKEYINFENREESIVALRKVKSNLEKIVKRQELSLDNVL